ncbi:DNA-binding transcriptional regulator, MarR family [Chryseobacterium oranimense]|uniref:DNA-binding transcriptional regulator, MarR family n=1 Tax=Chryseobacterium oranimense TaxID=421058 RepID=A0A1M5K9H6_9FLAO|nr:MarR family winged helix-turn-helix transcriptional regulator [Chryseobacterium oranimense]SHG48823.1 DNA-binding transcriptional regulator, MarR family [Chryseobacterium oranimense]
MNFDLIKAVVELVQQFSEQNEAKAVYSNNLQGFTEWLTTSCKSGSEQKDPDWRGKQLESSSDIIINTLLIRMSRYAKSYSRSSISNSVFTSQDDIIYLISLKMIGAMTKMELIKRNIQEKSSGIVIINRLIRNGWAEQTVTEKDKRTKHIQITEKGLSVLEEHMDEIGKVSKAMVGNLDYSEQKLLIAILSKLDEFHDNFYRMNLEARDLLDNVYKRLN